jgi:hypothetical protein
VRIRWVSVHVHSHVLLQFVEASYNLALHVMYAYVCCVALYNNCNGQLAIHL